MTAVPIAVQSISVSLITGRSSAPLLGVLLWPKSSAVVSLNANHVLVAALGVGADYLVSVPLWCGNHHPHPTHGALVNHRLRSLLHVGFEVPQVLQGHLGG